jgi:hypothetical protein
MLSREKKSIELEYEDRRRVIQHDEVRFHEAIRHRGSEWDTPALQNWRKYEIIKRVVN